MRTFRRTWRPAAALLALCLFPAEVFSQSLPEEPSLRIPTIAASAAAAADWATTYHALRNYRVREMNPLLRGFDDTPGRLVSVGAAIDAVGFSAWNLTMGRRHPRAAVAGLWAMTAFRAYLAVHNLRNTQKASKR